MALEYILILITYYQIVLSIFVVCVVSCMCVCQILILTCFIFSCLLASIGAVKGMYICMCVYVYDPQNQNHICKMM